MWQASRLPGPYNQDRYITGRSGGPDTISHLPVGTLELTCSYLGLVLYRIATATATATAVVVAPRHYTCTYRSSYRFNIYQMFR